MAVLDLPRELAEVGRFDELIRHNARRGEYGPGDPEALTEERLALMRRFEPHHFTPTRPDGTVLDIIGRPISIEGHTAGFVSAFIDITHHKRAEEVIRSLNAELEQRVAARTAELEAANRQLAAFNSSVSHDLRAPLRAIGGYLGMLREDLPEPLGEASRALFARIGGAIVGGAGPEGGTIAGGTGATGLAGAHRAVLAFRCASSPSRVCLSCRDCTADC